MTTNVLRIDASIFGNGGASTQLNERVVENLKNRYADVQVTHRDLAQNPLPHLTVDFVYALGKDAEKRSPEEAEQVALADQLIEEVRNADVLVIGAPMYNFSVPSTLKTWMDYVARAGDTFQYTETGPQGLLSDTKVYINTSRGGMHKGQPTDTVVPLLTSWLALLGLTDVSVVYAEGLNMSAEGREKALAEAEKQIDSEAA